jgi:hypothetical protein
MQTVYILQLGHRFIAAALTADNLQAQWTPSAGNLDMPNSYWLSRVSVVTGLTAQEVLVPST